MHHTHSLTSGVLQHSLCPLSLIYWTEHSLSSDYKSCIYHILNLVLSFFFLDSTEFHRSVDFFLCQWHNFFKCINYVRLKVELYLVGLFLSFFFIQILRNNRISLWNSIKNSIRTFGYNCIESIDHFGEDWNLLIQEYVSLYIQFFSRILLYVLRIIIKFFSWVLHSSNCYGDWGFISLHFQSDHWWCIGKLLNSAFFFFFFASGYLTVFFLLALMVVTITNSYSRRVKE